VEYMTTGGSRGRPLEQPGEVPVGKEA
jgi:hypothetical protein